jgi:hypothetical protein
MSTVGSNNEVTLMISVPTNPERRGARDRNVGGPTRPTPPGANIQYRGARTRKRATSSPLPPELLTPPQYPKPDAATLAAIDGITDAAHKATKSAPYIIHAISQAAPLSFIETELALPAGSLIGILLSDRDLLLQYCTAEVAAANVEDAEARRILTVLAEKTRKTDHTRIALNYSNSLRTAAEGRRRLSEALLRKATLTAKDEAAAAKSRLQRYWDQILCTDHAFLPTVEISLPPAVTDALSAARHILPLLERELAARKADGETVPLLSEHVRLCRNFIQRKSAATNQTREAPMPGS